MKKRDQGIHFSLIDPSFEYQEELFIQSRNTQESFLKSKLTQRQMDWLVRKVLLWLAKHRLHRRVNTCKALEKVLGKALIVDLHGEKLYVFGSTALTTWDLFDIDAAIHERSVLFGLKLSSCCGRGAAVGLPFNIPYRVDRLH